MRKTIQLDEFIIMPNYFHAIIRILKGADVGTDERTNKIAGDQQVAPTGPKSRSIGALIAGFKSATTKRINKIRRSPGVPVWQRNYYEDIILNEILFHKMRRYIMDNPKTWATDKLNPQCTVPAENDGCVIANPVE